MDPAPSAHMFHEPPSVAGTANAPTPATPTATTPNATTTDAPPTYDVKQIMKAVQLLDAAAAAGNHSASAEIEQLRAAALGKKSEPSKRKKTKTKSSPHATAIPDFPVDHQIVQKHLDEWLDNCLKDAPLTSSSSEFLDNNFPSLNNLTATSSSNKQPQQQHTQPAQHRSGGTMNNHHTPNSSSSQAAVAAAAFFLNGGGSGAKASETPNSRSSVHNDPFNGISGGYQKYFPMYPPNFGGGGAMAGHHNSNHHMSNYMNGGGGIGMGGIGGSRQSNINSDFSSLPPAVNMMNHGKDLRIDAQDILDGLEHRHFSDPCLAGASDDSKDSGNGQNGRSSNSIKNDSTKMLSTILEQIGVLHETNTKICRSLHENKVDIEALKHAPSWGGMRHRRDSISGLSTHSQPLGYAFGTHSPAPTFHSGMYTPGMLTDVVREVKDAARVREDALLSRVKAMVEERSWMVNDTNVKLLRDLEEMKIQINHLKSERQDTKTHISKMEDEIKSLKTLLTHVLHASANSPPRASSSSSHYHHPIQSSQSFNDRGDYNASGRTRIRPVLNLNYGTISNNDDTDLAYATEEDIIRPMNQHFNEIRKAEKKYAQANGKHRDSISSDHEPTSDGHIVQMEKDTLELRRELQDALASKKQAENKILALENIVLKLQNGQPHHDTDSSNHSHHNNTHPNSRTSSFSEGPAHSSSTSSTVIKHQHHSTPNTTSKLTSNISLTGPVTDL